MATTASSMDGGSMRTSGPKTAVSAVLMSPAKAPAPLRRIPTRAASASGVPVLAAASGGLPEAICNPQTGLLIPTHDPHAWAETLEALLTDEPRRTLMGATGRDRALAMTWERAAHTTLQKYRRIL